MNNISRIICFILFFSLGNRILLFAQNSDIISDECLFVELVNKEKFEDALFLCKSINYFDIKENYNLDVSIGLRFVNYLGTINAVERYSEQVNEENILLCYIYTYIYMSNVHIKQGKLDDAERCILRAISYSDKVNKNLHIHQYLDYKLLKILAYKNNVREVDRILSLNYYDYLDRQKRKDKNYYLALAKRAESLDSAILIDALYDYREIFSYCESIENPVDSIGLENYVRTLNAYSYYLSTKSDTLRYKSEYERAKRFIKEMCVDELTYYINLYRISVYIDKKTSHIAERNIILCNANLSLEKKNLDVLLYTFMRRSEELYMSHDSIKLLKFISEAEYYVEHIEQYSSSMQDFLLSRWIFSNYDIQCWENILRVAPIYMKNRLGQRSDEISIISPIMSSEWTANSVINITEQFIYEAATKVINIETLKELYNYCIFNKCLLIRQYNNIHKYLLEKTDPSIIYFRNKLDSLRNFHKELEQTSEDDSLIVEIKHEIDNIERIFSNITVQHDNKKNSWYEIRDNLKEKEVAIEFVNFWGCSDVYYALILRKDYNAPQLKFVFELPCLYEFENVPENVYSIKNTELYMSLCDSIKSLIQPGETIYFSPTGVLHQLAIESLPYDSVRTMSDVYNMVRLSSTREVVTNKSEESYKSAVVYGGISYDLDNNDILAESNRYPELKHRSLENDSINRGSARFLLGTKEEAEKVNKLLSDSKIESVIYKTKSANEESFKSLSGKHNNILHIATHSFTWTDSIACKQDYFAERMRMQLIGENQMYGHIIDPLDRCGLLFAGANTALQGKSKELPDGVQDGILTAKEISLMDLRDAELVVLSACETAKGDIISEGVFGLQRAFKMAGAKTIIMSLWKVDDRATQLLMTEFYTNWISKKQPKREAFRNAQNAVRYYKDKYGDYIYLNKPYYWAGFIMLD